VAIGYAILRLILGRSRVEAMKAARVRRSPDREILQNTYLPAFAAEGGVILWVGCRPYTGDYPALLESQGATVWSMDIDPRNAAWGREGRHRTGDIREVDRLFPDVVFDAVLCNGVLGFGVDALEDQARALGAMAAVLRPGGRLLLGWNTDKIADPVAAGLTAASFEPIPFAGQPPRIAVAGVTHVYDTLVRR
jgi:SAM-dependent methyltransferase